MNFLTIEILQCKISAYSSPCDKALLSVEQDFIPEPETKHLIGSLIPFTDTTLNGIDLMQLPVMMPDGSDTIERIAGLCVWHTGDASSVVHMGFLDGMCLSQQLGDIAVSLLRRNTELTAKPLYQSLTHDAHECRISEALAPFPLILIQSNNSGV